jgi:hypothetical protein
MEILETTAISFEIENIINSSIDFVIIVSPYLKINNRLRPKLSDCFKRNSRNIILYRESELSKEEKTWLTMQKNLELIPIRNLHAKCYINETTMLMSSMNLYDFSQINNHELGLMVKKNEFQSGKNLFEEMLKKIKAIIHTDYPNYDFSYFLSEVKVLTMGNLYKEVTQLYEFPKRKKEFDGTYLHICDLARQIHRFSYDDLYLDNSAILRDAVLSDQDYEKIKKAVIKVGVRK